MLSITSDQVLALAPDESSRKAGQGLANAAKWQNTGTSERAAWGEFQGSGSKPYQTCIDAASLAVKCSCPSRKFPCKHGIGLLILIARNGSPPPALEPDWAAEWLNKRTDKAAAAPLRQEKSVPDAAAQAKRSAARDEKVSGGLMELERWLKDVVRNGLIQLPEKPQKFFDDISRRLVDAQAPGIARMLRELAEMPFYTEGWQTPLLDQLGRLYLAIEGFRRPGALPPEILQELRTFIGYPQGTEILNAQPAISGNWLVAGSQYEQEAGLSTERHWLISSSGHAALVLQFVPFSARPAHNLFPGQTFEGELAYYPAAQPLRAGIRSQGVPGAPVTPQFVANWLAVATLETDKLQRSAFATDQLYAVAALRPVSDASGQWLIEDESGHQMQLREHFSDFWKWLALGGGAYLPTMVLGSEHSYTPLGVWTGTNYTSLS